LGSSGVYGKNPPILLTGSHERFFFRKKRTGNGSFLWTRNRAVSIVSGRPNYICPAGIQTLRSFPHPVPLPSTLFFFHPDTGIRTVFYCRIAVVPEAGGCSTDKIIKIIGALAVAGLVLAIGYVIVDTAARSAQSGALPVSEPVYFFYGEECSHCHAVMPFIRNLSAKYPAANIQMLEIWHNQTNQATYQAVLQRFNKGTPGVPAVVIGDTVLVGERDIPAKLEALILKRSGK
jgi:thiol-disulfide isomerase/thioredoxin